MLCMVNKCLSRRKVSPVNTSVPDNQLVPSQGCLRPVCMQQSSVVQNLFTLHANSCSHRLSMPRLSMRISVLYNRHLIVSVYIKGALLL